MEDDIINRKLIALEMKINELVECLADNELFRKVPIEPLYDEEAESEEETTD